MHATMFFIFYVKYNLVHCPPKKSREGQKLRHCCFLSVWNLNTVNVLGTCEYALSYIDTKDLKGQLHGTFEWDSKLKSTGVQNTNKLICWGHSLHEHISKHSTDPQKDTELACLCQTRGLQSPWLQTRHEHVHPLLCLMQVLLSHIQAQIEESDSFQL